MQDEKRKISKLKALIIKEQKLLLGLIASTAKNDQKGISQTADTPDYLTYNSLLAKQLQLLSRLFNQQTKKQSIIALSEEEKTKNSIHIDNLDAVQDYRQDEASKHTQPNLRDGSVDEQEESLVDAPNVQSTSDLAQSQYFDQSRPNIR